MIFFRQAIRLECCNFKVAEAILEKRAGYRDYTIGQDGDDPTIRKLLSKFLGNSEIDFRKKFLLVQPIRETMLPESPSNLFIHLFPFAKRLVFNLRSLIASVKIDPNWTRCVHKHF